MTPNSEIAIIVGAAGGIGAAVCRRLNRDGYRLAITDANAVGLGRIRSELSAGGRDTPSGVLDASDAGQFGAFVHDIEAALGPVAVLVNCSGLFQIGSIVTTTDETWDLAIRANLTSVFVTCRAVVPRMMERGRGAIVNVASAAGEMGSVRPAAHYAAAKGGVIALSKSLAREVSPHGVRVNVVSPGPVDTPMLQVNTLEERERAASGTLLKRLGSPDEIAAAIAFLASDASAFTTGAVLRVNGGVLV